MSRLAVGFLGSAVLVVTSKLALVVMGSAGTAPRTDISNRSLSLARPSIETRPSIVIASPATGAAEDEAVACDKIDGSLDDYKSVATVLVTYHTGRTDEAKNTAARAGLDVVTVYDSIDSILARWHNGSERAIREGLRILSHSDAIDNVMPNVAMTANGH
jgi:hypothetical protein